MISEIHFLSHIITEFWSFWPFLIILDLFRPFWIVSRWNLDQSNINIDENYWKIKFIMILMSFDIRNSFFEPHYYGILIILTLFDNFGPYLIVVDRFPMESWSKYYKNRWNYWKTKFIMILMNFDIRNSFFDIILSRNLIIFHHFGHYLTLSDRFLIQYLTEFWSK